MSSDIFVKAFAWLKGLVIVNWGIKAIKQLWPFLLIFIFWPEIDAMMYDICPGFWGNYIASISEVLINGANYFREIPFLEPIFTFLDEFLSAAKYRIIDLLS